MAGPLAGIRVVEIANFISGPYTGMLLADLGADVVKVEMTRTGDPFRLWGAYPVNARPQFSAYNRGKKSLAIDIRRPDGQEVIRRLALRADILVENFRPGAMDRLGLGYGVLGEINPRLIYCSITGMGQSGPLAQRPSYDSVGLAMSGLWSRFISLDRPKPVGPQIGDQLTSLYSVYGILGALFARGETGLGQRVDVNMLLANLAFIPEPVANYLVSGEVGATDMRAKRSQAYAMVARDGKPLTVHLSSVPKFWEGLTAAIGRPELVEDPRFATNAQRVRNYDELRSLLDEIFKTRDRAQWLDELAQHDVPAAPINNVEEALANPQAEHIGVVEEFGTGDRAIRLVRCPVDYSGTSIVPVIPPPRVGEHSREILADLGYTEAAIQALHASGTFSDGTEISDEDSSSVHAT